MSKDESLESTLVSRLSPALSDFHFVGVFWPSQNAPRPQDITSVCSNGSILDQYIVHWWHHGDIFKLVKIVIFQHIGPRLHIVAKHFKPVVFLSGLIWLGPYQAWGSEKNGLFWKVMSLFMIIEHVGFSVKYLFCCHKRRVCVANNLCKVQYWICTWFSYWGQKPLDTGFADSITTNAMQCNEEAYLIPQHTYKGIQSPQQLLRIVTCVTNYSIRLEKAHAGPHWREIQPFEP